MKHFLIPLLAILCLAAVCTGCGSKPIGPDIPEEPDPPVCGGSDDYIDPDAPKTIRSTVINEFSCYMGLMSYDLRDYPVLCAPWYRFEAVRSGGKVKCSREVAGAETVTFTADTAFLDDVQAIVAQYDWAQYNGAYHFTHGLPENFGATVDVKYESGESIYSSDNQDEFLPPACCEALVRLFCGYGQDWLTINGDEARAIMAQNGYVRVVDVRRADEFAAGHIPYAVNVPNEDIQAADGVLEDLPDTDEALLIYCRSGRRSAQAAEKLTALGYTCVTDFGGINSWPGDVVTD